MLQEEKHSGFLNEAKEWAGELLSGQTKVGGREIGKKWKKWATNGKHYNGGRLIVGWWAQRTVGRKGYSKIPLFSSPRPSNVRKLAVKIWLGGPGKAQGKSIKFINFLWNQPVELKMNKLFQFVFCFTGRMQQ